MRSSLLRLALLNAVRDRTRSALTAGIVVGGTALTIVSLAWLDGIWAQVLEESTDTLGHARVVTGEHAAREALAPTDADLEDAGAVVEAARATPGVVAAYAMVQAGAHVAVAGGSGAGGGGVPGTVVGAPEGYFTEHADLDARLVEGRWLVEGRGELVLGRKLKERIGARLGDVVEVRGASRSGAVSPARGTLVGVVAAGTQAVDRRAFIDLGDARRMLGTEAGATKVLAFARDYRQGEQVAAALAASPALRGLDVKGWQALPPWDGQVGAMEAIRFVVVSMVAFLAGLGVWNTMMMSVLERTREVGVLRALGMTRLGAVSLFAFEALAISLAGGAVGVVAGALPALWMERVGFRYPASILAQVPFPMPDTLYADLTAGTVGLALATAVLTALVGAVVPALRAAAIPPDAAMRSR